MVKYRYLGIASGFFLTCFSLAFLFIEAKKGNVVTSIVFAGLSWIGYLLIHKSETGRLIDTMESIEEHRENKEEGAWEPQKTKALLGPLVFVAGTVVLSRGVVLENYIMAFIGALGVIGGYAVFHYFMEGALF